MPLLVNTVSKDEDASDNDSSEDNTDHGVAKKVRQLEATLAAVNRTQFERLPYPIIVGSGAAESVLPTEWPLQAQLLPSNSAGKTYSAANGSTIRNKGSKIVPAVTKEGKWHNLQFEVANVTKALASVSKICSKDQSVIYNPPWHEEGSYIYTIGTLMSIPAYC